MDPDPQGVTDHSNPWPRAERLPDESPRARRLREWIEDLETDGFAARRATCGLIVRGWYAWTGTLPRQRRPWRFVRVEVDGRFVGSVSDAPFGGDTAFARLWPGDHHVRLVGDDDVVLLSRSITVRRGRAPVIGFVPPRPAAPWAGPRPTADWRFADVPVHRTA